MTEHANLAAALAHVQATLPHVQKTKTANVKSDKASYSYKYADLADIAAAIVPLLGKAGLAWVTLPTLRETGHFVLTYRLVHVSGEEVTGDYPLPDPLRSTAQQIGSAITYARRYVLCCVTGIVPDEDDDAHATSHITAATPPVPPAVTDQAWLETWRAEVLLTDDVGRLHGLLNEAKQAYEDGKLLGPDAKDARALIEERMAEVQKTATVVTA